MRRGRAGKSLLPERGRTHHYRCPRSCGQRLLPPLASALTHGHRGVRYAACQCVRALSRSDTVTRTSLLDSGLGAALFAVFTKEHEERRVVHVALAAVCNLVNQYSPLRTPFLQQGVAPRLARLLRSPNSELRLSALWALKSLVYKCAPETKRFIMVDVGWPALDERLDDTEEGVREQALKLLRNFADCEDDMDAVFDVLGRARLLNALASALETRRGNPREDFPIQCVVGRIEDRGKNGGWPTGVAHHFDR